MNMHIRPPESNFVPTEEDLKVYRRIKHQLDRLLPERIIKEFSVSGEGYHLNFYPQLNGEFGYISGVWRSSIGYCFFSTFSFNTHRLRN